IAGLAGGHVTVGANRSTIRFMPALLAEFTEHYPKVELTLRQELNEDIARLLREGDLDTCLLVTGVDATPVPDDVSSRRLFSFDYVFVVRPDHRLAGRAQVELTELKDERFILPVGRNMRAMHTTLTKAGLSPHVAIEV